MERCSPIKFAAGLIFFNDCRSLKRCLDSLAPFEKVYCIDGKFPAFDYPSELSDDGSRELVQSYPNTVLLDCPKSEIEKRQFMLDTVKEDVLMWIDSDDWIEGDYEQFTSNIEANVVEGQNVYGMMMWTGTTDRYRPSIIYRPWEMDYFERHFGLKRKDQKGIPNSFQPTGQIHKNIEGMRKYGNDDLRSSDYLKRHVKFQKWQMLNEKHMEFIFAVARSEDCSVVKPSKEMLSVK